MPVPGLPASGFRFSALGSEIVLSGVNLPDPRLFFYAHFRKTLHSKDLSAQAQRRAS